MPLYLDRGGGRGPAHAGRRARGGRGVRSARLARGAVDNRPRERLPLDGGQFAVMPCVDGELGVRRAQVVRAGRSDGTPFLVVLFSLEHARLEAVIEADKLGQLRTGAASGVAARYLARAGRGDARRDRLRLAGRVADRVRPAALPGDRACRRLLPQRRAARGVLRRARLRAGGVPSRGGRAGRRRHGDDVQGSGAARRVAARRAHSSVRSARTTPRRARARQRRARARGVRLLRLARAVEA